LWLEDPKSICQQTSPWSFDCAPYATDLRGASLMMTGLLGVEKHPVRRAENTNIEKASGFSDFHRRQ
jgi:hypothetical protein